MVILGLGRRRIAVHDCACTTSDHLGLLGFKNTLEGAPQYMLIELNNRLAFLAVTQMATFSEMTST